MNLEIELPDMGELVGDTAIVSEWYFEEGDFVEEGEALLEVVAGDETLDIPAPASGVLRDCHVVEDDLVRIGDVLAILDCQDDDPLLDDEAE